MPDKDPVEIARVAFARSLMIDQAMQLREVGKCGPEAFRIATRAALAALSAEGFAVVRRSANRAQWDVWQALHGFEPLTDEAWARIQAAGESPEIWDAMLAAAERESGGADEC